MEASPLLHYKLHIREGLAVASMARDDPSTLPGDDPSLALNSSVLTSACTATTMRGKSGSEIRNLKPKLAIMLQCTSVTDRWTDRRTLTSQHKREMCILHLGWRFSAVVASFVARTKLLNVEPG